MSKRKLFILFTVVIAIATLSAVSEALDLPYGVPNSPLAPTECTTGPNGYFKVSVDISSGTTFSECDYKLCTRYAYKVENTGSKSYQQDHALIEISADQVLLDIEALNASYELPSVLGDADSTTKMGLYDKHEYWVRFNASEKLPYYWERRRV